MLTPKEQKFAEDNHNLIYAFCYKYKLDVEEWYDILAIKYCKSIMNYEPSKGEFSTYLYLNLKHAFFMELRKQKCLKRGGDINISSLEEMMDSNKYGVGKSNADVEKSVIQREALETALRNVLPIDKKILKLSMKGLNQKQIGDEVGLSQAQVSRRLKILRKECGYDG